MILRILQIIAESLRRCDRVACNFSVNDHSAMHYQIVYCNNSNDNILFHTKITTLIASRLKLKSMIRNKLKQNLVKKKEVFK